MDAAGEATRPGWEAVERAACELLAGLEQADVLNRLCARTLVELRCDASHVFVWSEERQGFAAVAQAGEAPEVWGRLRLVEAPAAALGQLPARLRTGPVCVRFTATAAHEGLAAASPDDLGLSPRVASLARRGGWRHGLFTPILQGERLLGFQTACWHDAGASPTSSQVELARRLGCLAGFAVRHVSLAGALERATRLQSEFVANMSHELRTPLNVIIGYTALLLEGEYGAVDEVQRDILARIALRARELFDMVRSTLDVGLLDRGDVAFEWRDFEVASLMAELETETRHLQTRPEVRFRWHREEPLPTLRSDPAKLRVVLSNLVANAAKFTERGEVNVLARATDGAIQFVVSDTGIGIEAEKMADIFEPFRRGGRGDEARRPGVGLGLYIVGRLVERLRGEVLVESQPGKGSRFMVQLPLRPPEAKG